MSKKQLVKMALACFATLAIPVHAVPFDFIRIGDIDGFGYDADANFGTLTGDGGLIDRNSNGLLEPNDVLPSLNGDMTVATGSGDDFDNRLAESINGQGFVDNGTTGVEFTDISLSTSYDASANNGQIYNANTSNFGSGGVFPAGASTALPNQPGFFFDFFVDDADIATGTTLFFNMVFADYDVTPAEIDFNFAAGNSTQAVTPQNNAMDDGLVQGAFATLAFNDVFTWNAGSGGWDGEVGILFDAPNEPYTAFDYVELSVSRIVVPEPNTLAIVGMGLLGLVWRRRRDKR